MSAPEEVRARRQRIALVASLLPILVLTLSPGPPTQAEQISVWCVVCGWRGASDALLNVALFTPFGLALAYRGVRLPMALLIGALLAVGIEVAQSWIPNRYPGFGDVLYNAAGAGFGAWLYAAVSETDPEQAARRWRRRAAVWGALGVVLLLSQTWLLRPAVVGEPTVLEWTPETVYGDQYAGRVLRFSVDGSEQTPGPIEADAPVVAALDAGADIELDLEVGPDPRALVPIVRVTGVGTDERDRFAVELDGRSVLVRYRTRGMLLHLDRPYARFRYAATAWTPGDHVSLRIRAVGDGIRMAMVRTPVGEGPRAEQVAHLRVPSARGWGFLMYPRPVASRAGTVVDFFWMLLVAFPLGLWGTARVAAGFGVAWIAVIWLTPVLSPLMSGSIPGSVGIGLGVAFGIVIRLARGNPEPFRWWEPLSKLYDDDLAQGTRGGEDG